VLDGHLAEIRAVDEVTVTTLLERLPTVIGDLYDTTLVFEGKSVHCPEQAREALESLTTGDGPFQATELPGRLDDEGRLVLVRRLIREGFLRRSGAGA
jgi:hypothetical protein